MDERFVLISLVLLYQFWSIKSSSAIGVKCCVSKSQLRRTFNAFSHHGKSVTVFTLKKVLSPLKASSPAKHQVSLLCRPTAQKAVQWETLGRYSLKRGGKMGVIGPSPDLLCLVCAGKESSRQQQHPSTTSRTEYYKRESQQQQPLFHASMDMVCSSSFKGGRA